jgi:hypothetical protein
VGPSPQSSTALLLNVWGLPQVLGLTVFSISTVSEHGARSSTASQSSSTTGTPVTPTQLHCNGMASFTRQISRLGSRLGLAPAQGLFGEYAADYAVIAGGCQQLQARPDGSSYDHPSTLTISYCCLRCCICVGDAE